MPEPTPDQALPRGIPSLIKDAKRLLRDCEAMQPYRDILALDFNTLADASRKSRELRNRANELRGRLERILGRLPVPEAYRFTQLSIAIYGLWSCSRLRPDADQDCADVRGVLYVNGWLDLEDEEG